MSKKRPLRNIHTYTLLQVLSASPTEKPRFRRAADWALNLLMKK